MHWNCLSGAYLRFEACQIQWHLLQVPTDKWFMKNHNFRRHMAANGVQIHENGICSSPPWVDLPLHNVSKPNILHNKCRKTIIIQKVLVTQNCNIVHCNWHTQNPICADLQAFANTFSLCKLKFFFQFVVRESSGNSQNITFCSFWLGKMDWNSLSGAYLRLEACQIQYHRFESLW